MAVPPGARGGGTRVTESYTVRWIPTWARIVDVPTNRARELREAMRHTLEQLKGAAEAIAVGPLSHLSHRDVRSSR